MANANYNRAWMTTATTGTGTITLGSATSGYQTFAAAGVPDGKVIDVVIIDGANWEISSGTYTSSGTTLSRTLISSSTGSLLNLTGSATVFISPHSGTSASVVVSTTPPSNPGDGVLWFDSTYGKLKIYYTDANSSQWIDAFVGTVGPAGPAGATGATGASGTIDGTTVTTFTGVLKGNGTNIATATAGTDYLAPPSGTSILKANSGGALANAAAGTDYLAPSGALGTPSSGTLTNCTGLPVSTGVSGLGTGIATALAVNTGSAGAPVLFNGAGGTPTSMTLTNATGLPIAGISASGTPDSTTFLRGDGTWNAPGAGSITNSEGSLGSDVQLASNNTWYDGPTVSLAAGTWLVVCHLTQVRTSNTAETIYARISDGTNHHASTQFYHAATTSWSGTLAMTAIITLGGTTTIKGQMASSAGATSTLMKAALVANGAGNNASQITAIKLS
jgi:hypothetical protein